MKKEIITSDLERHAKQVLQDMHLLLTHDIATFDMPYYNDLVMIVDQFTEALKKAEEDRVSRANARVAQYNRTKS